MVKKIDGPSRAEDSGFSRQENDAAAPSVAGKVVKGKQIVENFEGKVFQGDAFDLFDTLPKECVDLIITSPPYWGHREYDLEHNWDFFNDPKSAKAIGEISKGYEWYREKGGVLGLEPYPDWYVSHLMEIFRKASRCLKGSGSLWINIGDTYFARWASIRDGGRQGLSGDDERKRRKTPMGGYRQEKQLLLIPTRFAIAMQNDGWILRNDAIWHKPNATPRPEGDRLRMTHEHFFHFVKRPKEGRAAYYYNSAGTEIRQSDVLIVNVAPGEEGHTATFPRELITPRILSSCPEGGVVLDPFCGTGRALEVALEFSRKVVGFEKQDKFQKLSQQKVADMAKGPAQADKNIKKDQGHFISEWFGHRIYPLIKIMNNADFAKVATAHNKEGKCPFLSEVQGMSTACVKSANSRGVCTISSASGATRRDWLACPYRVIHTDIVQKGCQRIFGKDYGAGAWPVPVSSLNDGKELQIFKTQIEKNGRGFLFFQDKLGGEISISGSDSNPEMSFDVTVVEIVGGKGDFKVGRYGIIEVQTMDFHGSYKKAVERLTSALDLHPDSFAAEVQKSQWWAKDGIEGPNIANVFKRTFYQMMIKFQLSSDAAAAGVMLAIPLAVWESWQPFLGKPEFVEKENGVWAMKKEEAPAGEKTPSKRAQQKALICVFDLEHLNPSPISPTKILKFIEISAEDIAKHALEKVPDTILKAVEKDDSIRSRIRTRLGDIWPDIDGSHQKVKGKKKTRQ